MPRVDQFMLASVAVVFVAAFLVHQVEGIGCFVCSSINNSTPECEDTFNNSKNFYRINCLSGRKNRMGFFPATNCVKLKGTIISTGKTIVVRTCVVDNGDINTETEIGRSNHCGLVSYMRFDDQPMKGCLLSCSTEGCNSAKTIRGTHISVFIGLLIGYMTTGKILDFSII